jgi:peptidoglycan/xylan/chitin deacetylase (PgdA/CDA1 family)
MTSSLARRARLLVLVLLLTACGGPPATPSATPSIGSPATSPSPSSGSQSAEPTSSPSPATTTYLVQPGDTLFGIAQRFAASVEELQAWNAAAYPSLATDPTSLQAGWTLIVAGAAGFTPQPTSTPAPTPIGTPVAASCHTGNRAAAIPRAVYYAIPNAGREVALTFDMGGRLDPAIDIMQFLIANRICTTLFPTGAMSQTAIGQRVLAVVRAHPELFEIGNHTMHHCDLVRGGLGSPTTAPCVTNGAPTAAFVRKELTDAAAILAAASGQQPVPYWRPPYGSINQTVLDAAASVGYTKTFMWSIDTIDWKPIAQGGPTAQQIASKVVTRAANGSTVLMHLGGYETLAALRIMVPALRQSGFMPTSLSDLLDGR